MSPHALGPEISSLMKRVDRYHRAARIALVTGAPAVALLMPNGLTSGAVPAWAFLAVGYVAGLMSLYKWKAGRFSKELPIASSQVMEIALITAVMLAAPRTVGVFYVGLLVLTLRTGLRHGRAYLLSGTLLSIGGLSLAMGNAALFRAEPELTMGLLLGPLIIPVYMGKVCRALVAARDEARKADIAKGRFLANMSHEFRTPLNSIQGMADLLASCELPHNADNYVRTIRSSAQGLGESVQELLDFATIEAGRIKVVRSTFSVRELTGSVRDEMYGLAAKKGLEFRLKIADNVPEYVNGDASHARRALISLICNAIKFTEKGWVEVHVSTQHRGSELQILCFRVRDSGNGFSDDVGDRLFEPFEQADSGLKRENAGTGLGLAIARGFVRANNGDIGFKSTPGVGSEFWFTFEVRSVSGSEIPAASPEAIGEMASVEVDPVAVPLNILVVDDQASNRNVFEAILRKAGHAVVAVENGSQAIVHLTQNWADMALVDLHMPGISGVDVLRWIRAKEGMQGLRKMPVLIVTADGTEGAHALVMEHGATSVVTKPVSMTDLLKNIRKHSAGRPMSQIVSSLSGAECYLSELREALGNDGTFNDYVLQALEDLDREVGLLVFPTKAPNAKCIADVAHSIKGVAGNLGLELVQRLAAELEGCIEADKDHERLPVIIAEINRLAADGARAIKARFVETRAVG